MSKTKVLLFLCCIGLSVAHLAYSIPSSFPNGTGSSGSGSGSTGGGSTGGGSTGGGSTGGGSTGGGSTGGK